MGVKRCTQSTNKKRRDGSVPLDWKHAAVRSPTLYLQERQASTCLIGARCRAAAFLSDSESKVKAQPLPFAMVIPSETTKRYLPWLVATALFMEQLDSTM